MIKQILTVDFDKYIASPDGVDIMRKDVNAFEDLFGIV